MQVTVETKDLQEAVARVKGVTSLASSSQPVLKNVKFDVQSGSGIVVSATDLDCTVGVLVDVPVRKGGEAIVPVTVLEKFLKKKGPLELGLEGEPKDPSLVLQNGATLKLRGYPSDSWPAGPPEHPHVGHGLISREALEAVLPFASDDDVRPLLTAVRPLLTAVLIKGRDLVATDSYRISQVRMKKAPFGQMAGDVVVPARYLRLILKDPSIEALEFDVHATYEQQKLPSGGTKRFLAGGYVTIVPVGPRRYESWNVRMLQGDYPDYPQLVGEFWKPDAAVLLNVERPALDQALVEVMPMISDNRTPVRIERLDDTTLQVRVISQGVGEISVPVPGSMADFGHSILAFNPKYLQSVLTGMESTTFLGESQSKPAALIDRRKEFEILRAIMPVRIS